MKTTLLLVMSAVLVPLMAHADGGAVRLHDASGPFLITVFTPPDPLRAGPIDTSVLIQDRETGAVILDAKVDLAIHPVAGGSPPFRTRATREQATNKLLKAASIALLAPGWWDLRVVVRRGPEEAELGTKLLVAQAAPRLGAVWPLLVLPAFAIALFALHQSLPMSAARRRRKIRVAVTSRRTLKPPTLAVCRTPDHSI